MTEFAVVDHAAEPTAVVQSTVKIADLPTFLGVALQQVLAALEAQHLPPGGEPFAYYRGMSDSSVEVESGFPAHGPFVAAGDAVPSELPSGRLVTGLHVEPYERLGATYAQMTAWATAHGLQPTNEMWEVYLTDPEREPDPARWQTRVYLRVD